MLCRRCSQALQEAGISSVRALRGSADGGLVCQRCGSVLVTEGLSARVLDKLAQLTRMGLRGQHGLLRPGPGREER
jgi:hypothetical protein